MLRHRYSELSAWPLMGAIGVIVVVGTVVIDPEQRPLLEGVALMLAIALPALLVAMEVSLQVRRRRRGRRA